MVVNSFSFVARRTPWESFVKVVIMVMVRRLPLCVAALSTHMVVTVAVDRVMVSAFIQQTTVAAIPHRHHLKKYKQVRSCCNCCSFKISWCSSKGVVRRRILRLVLTWIFSSWASDFRNDACTESAIARLLSLQRWILFLCTPCDLGSSGCRTIGKRNQTVTGEMLTDYSPILVYWCPYSSRLLQLNNLERT